MPRDYLGRLSRQRCPEISVHGEKAYRLLQLGTSQTVPDMPYLNTGPRNNIKQLSLLQKDS